MIKSRETKKKNDDTDYNSAYETDVSRNKNQMRQTSIFSGGSPSKS